MSCSAFASPALRALANGLELDAATIEETTGISLETLEEVMEGMKRAKFGVILFGMGLTMTRGKHLNSEAVLALARDMNEHTRWSAKPMRGHGNVTGADNVVSWSTGYPFGVHRGSARLNPYRGSDGNVGKINQPFCQPLFFREGCGGLQTSPKY